MEAKARTGAAAILAGALYFAGQGGQLVFGDDVPDAIYVAFGSAGFVALAVALWGLREVIAGTRLGRIGIRVALAGVVFLALFAIQVFVELIRPVTSPRTSSCSRSVSSSSSSASCSSPATFDRRLGEAGCSRLSPSSASSWRSF